VDNTGYVLETVQYLWNIHLQFRRSFLTVLGVFGFVSYQHPTVVLGFAKRWAAKDGIGKVMYGRGGEEKGNIPLEEDAEHTHTRVTNYHTPVQQIFRCSTWWNRTVVSDWQEDTSFLPLGPVFRVSVSFVSWRVVVLLEVSSLWFSNFSFFCV